MGIMHPNNDSELTLLMRDMYDYYDSLKVHIENDDLPENIRQFAEIHSSVATEPSKSESDLFKAMSDVYLESAKKLEGKSGDKRKAFNFMVNTPDGLNLPLLVHGTGYRDTLFGESFAHDIADIENPQASLLYRWVIQEHNKLLLTYDGKVNRYKPVHLREEKRPQLFDLLADPHEKKNLATANPDVVARLATAIQDWWPVTERNVQTTAE